MFGPRSPAAPMVISNDHDRSTADAERDSEVDDLAETTRQQLTKMYDARLAAPVLVDGDAAAPAPQPAPTRAPARSRPSTPRAVRPQRLGRRKLLIAVALLVVAVLGVRYVRGALAKNDAAAVRDPNTAVESLPWHTVRYGEILVDLPTKASTATLDDTSGNSYRYDRYVLPDVTFTVTVRSAIPSLSSDAALRGYTTSVVSQLGGRVLNGVARDVTFGTSFSASVDLPDGPAQMYVLSTSGSVIELRADIPRESSGRALKIYERVIRSFAPA
jgi:hypothetical protein